MSDVSTLIKVPNNPRVFAIRRLITTVGIAIFIGLLDVKAQDVSSFEKLLDHALKNHPQLVNHELKIDEVRLEQGINNQWSPLEVSYQGGQINYEGFDHFFTVGQDLTHLFERNQQNKVNNKQVKFLSYESLLIANDIKYALKEAFDEFCLQEKRQELSGSLLVVFDDLEQTIKDRFNSGIIDTLDKKLLIQKLMRFRQEVHLDEHQLREAEFRLRKASFLPDEIPLPDGSLERMSLKDFQVDSTVNIYMNSFELKREVLNAESSMLARQAGTPTVHVGYFVQSLEKQPGFQGLSIGLGIPLHRGPVKAQREQNEIRESQIDNDRNARLQELYLNVNRLKEKAEILEDYLDRYEEKMSKEQHAIEQLAQRQLNEGQLGISEFIDIHMGIFSAKNAYFTQLFEYNQTILRLSYLTQTAE